MIVVLPMICGEAVDQVTIFFNVTNVESLVIRTDMIKTNKLGEQNRVLAEAGCEEVMGVGRYVLIIVC